MHTNSSAIREPPPPPPRVRRFIDAGTTTDRLAPVEAMIKREVADQDQLASSIVQLVRRASTQGAMGTVAGSMLVVAADKEGHLLGLRALGSALGTEAVTFDATALPNKAVAEALQAKLNATATRSGTRVLILDHIAEAPAEAVDWWTRHLRREGVDVVAKFQSDLPTLDLSSTIVVAVVPPAENSESSALRDVIEGGKREGYSTHPYLSSWDHITLTTPPSREKLRARLDAEVSAVRDELERTTSIGSIPIRLAPSAKAWLAERVTTVYELRWFVQRYVRGPVVEAIATGQVKTGDMVSIFPNAEGDSLTLRAAPFPSVTPVALRTRRLKEAIRKDPPLQTVGDAFPATCPEKVNASVYEALRPRHLAADEVLYTVEALVRNYSYSAETACFIAAHLPIAVATSWRSHQTATQAIAANGGTSYTNVTDGKNNRGPTGMGILIEMLGYPVSFTTEQYERLHADVLAYFERIAAPLQQCYNSDFRGELKALVDKRLAALKPAG